MTIVLQGLNAYTESGVTTEAVGRFREFRERVIRRLPELEQARVDKALQLAFELHHTQADRPDGTPYFNHPLSVASKIVCEFGIRDGDYVCTALLHDAVEDQAEALAQKAGKPCHTLSAAQEVSLQYIAQEFGRNVGEAVSLLSNFISNEAVSKLSEETGVPTQEAKNRLYLEHVVNSVTQNDTVFVVKLADFCENFLSLNSIGDASRREELRCKYLPLRDFFLQALSGLTEDHTLASVRDSILAQLRAG